MEQSREPPDKPTQYSPLSTTNEARIYNGEMTVSSITGAGKTGQLHIKIEIRTLSNTIHKNKLNIE